MKKASPSKRGPAPAGSRGDVRLAVFCSGFGSNFQAVLDSIHKKKLRAEIALMVCDNPGAFALSRAKKHGIPVALLSPKLFDSREAYEKVIVAVLKNQKIDLIVLAGFMRILTPYFIGAFRGRILNIHPSYLPAFKGAHAIRDAFDAEVRTTGVTVHYVTAEVDGGPVILQEKVTIGANDTLESLEKKIHSLEHRLYPEAIGRAAAKLR